MPRKPFDAPVHRVFSAPNQNEPYRKLTEGLKIAVDYARRLKAGVVNDTDSKKSS